MLYAAPRPKKAKKPSTGADAQQPKPRARSIASGAAPGDSEKDYIVSKLIRERRIALNGCHSIAADASSTSASADATRSTAASLVALVITTNLGRLLRFLVDWALVRCGHCTTALRARHGGGGQGARGGLGDRRCVGLGRCTHERRAASSRPPHSGPCRVLTDLFKDG